MSDIELDTTGAVAPPRSNGELVFNEPWEGRAFGIVMSLCERNEIAWSRFREHLIDEIAGSQTGDETDTNGSYYACWLRALETTVAEKGLLQRESLEQRSLQYAARPHGHDHTH